MEQQTKYTPLKHDEIIALSTGKMLYVVTKKDIFSFWFAGINPKSDRSFLGISSVGKCEVIPFSGSLVYIDYTLAKHQFVEVLREELAFWEENCGIPLTKDTAAERDSLKEQVERLKESIITLEADNIIANEKTEEMREHAQRCASDLSRISDEYQKERSKLKEENERLATWKTDSEKSLLESGQAVGILSEQLEFLLNEIDARGYRNDFKKQRSVLRDYKEIAERVVSDVNKFKDLRDINKSLVEAGQNIIEWCKEVKMTPDERYALEKIISQAKALNS